MHIILNVSCKKVAALFSPQYVQILLADEIDTTMIHRALHANVFNKKIWTLFQYLIRRLIVRSREVLKPQDW